MTSKLYKKKEERTHLIALGRHRLAQAGALLDLLRASAKSEPHSGSFWFSSVAT